MPNRKRRRLPPVQERRPKTRTRKKLPEANHVQLRGRVDEVRNRWTPNGGMAVDALLIIPRTAVTSEQRVGACEQPIPLRARGEQAKALSENNGKLVDVTGQLRRRMYMRQQKTHWGQVEIWVMACQPTHQEMQDDPAR